MVWLKGSTRRGLPGLNINDMQGDITARQKAVYNQKNMVSDK